MARRNPEGFYVYAYFEPGCALPFYVGKGHGDRLRKHLYPHKAACRTAMAKKLRQLKARGITPIIKVIAQGLSESSALAFEKFAIWVCGRRDQGTGCLMNHTDGGEGSSGKKVSPETRRKLSLANRGQHRTDEFRERLRQVNTGRQHTEATKRKLSEAHKGRTLHIEQRRKIGRSLSKAIFAVSLADASVQEFDSRSEAGRHGFPASSVHRAIVTGREYRGFIWKYKGANDETEASRGE